MKPKKSVNKGVKLSLSYIFVCISLFAIENKANPFPGVGIVWVWAKWPIRLEHIPVSVAWSDWEYFYSPLDGMLLHCNVTPSSKLASTHLYTWERYCESKVSSPKAQHSVPGQGTNPNHLIWRLVNVRCAWRKLFLRLSKPHRLTPISIPQWPTIT